MIGPGIQSPVLTAEGGIGIYIINKTGAASVKGTVLEASTALDLAVQIESAGGIEPVGIMYSDGIADGDLVLIIILGIAEILLEDTTACVHGDWCGVSASDDGRAIANTEPPAPLLHDKEIGHFIESKSAGTNVLAKAILHYR